MGRMWASFTEGMTGRISGEDGLPLEVGIHVVETAVLANEASLAFWTDDGKHSREPPDSRASGL
jgi:hypothetical protein